MPTSRCWKESAIISTSSTIRRRSKRAAGFGELHVVRRELLMLRRAIWPLRDAISALRSEMLRSSVTDATRIYLRDCYDHAVQLIDLLESYRDIAGDVRDYYLSTISNRMNEIMKTLTVIATIFLPLTFIAGVYGMNFNPNNRRGTCRNCVGGLATSSRWR